MDPAKILRVLLNLVSNAIKFSPSGRQVEVGVAPWVAPATDDSQPREWACLWVKDEGLGIPQDEVTKLFKKFSATSVRPTAGEKGTGLGLYIVKEIVELHQGCVEVETRPGRGSTFRVLLPSAGEP
ncbi:MAG: ATP-binding protein [Candidatus Riflebacteria bacterium]|nr:ATP-binding protein [Candidatus Riflebacteria bacterium]